MIDVYLVILLLIAFVVYREMAYRRDVGKLLDRIMAKSFPEYLVGENKKPAVTPVSMSDREEYEAERKRMGEIPEKEES